MQYEGEVIAITLTPVRHKRHMQFLTLAPNCRGRASADPMTRPSRAPAQNRQQKNRMNEHAQEIRKNMQICKNNDYLFNLSEL